MILNFQVTMSLIKSHQNFDVILFYFVAALSFLALYKIMVVIQTTSKQLITHKSKMEAYKQHNQDLLLNLNKNNFSKTDFDEKHHFFIETLNLVECHLNGLKLILKSKS